jgi:DNA-binding transcriptional ArsR family regulator
MAAIKGAKSAKRVGRKAQRPAADLSLDERIAKALNHPLRTQILVILNERVGSPRELVPLVGAPLPTVAYHVRVLLKYGCIEVVNQEQVRGALKTRYRATTRMLLDRENWDQLSKETRNGISMSAVGEVIDRASDAIEADTFDSRTDRAVITLKFDADERAWSDAMDIIRDAYERLSEVETEAANRSGEKFRVTVSMLGYESPTEGK